MLVVLVALWVVVVVGFSWLSGFVDQSCPTDACADRVQTAWAVLMGLQLLWTVGFLALAVRPRMRWIGLGVGAVLPPATLAVVNAVAYPAGALF